MDSISQLSNAATAAPPEMSVGEARGLLLRAPQTLVLTIIDNGHALGCLDRAACLAASDLTAPIRSIMTPFATDGLGETLAATAREELASAPFKRQFLDLMNKELRSPLDSVLAMTECLERQPLGADAQSHVRTIREAAMSLQRLVAAAVDLSRAESGLMRLACEPVQLRSLIDDIQSEWSARAARDGLTLLVSFDGDADLAALTDRARLRQVFDSLIDSALEQTRTGSIEVGLKASSDREGVHLEGRVRDTSAGLSPDRLARIFEPGHDSTPGVGLGLALARQIILGLNGCIRAESNVGAGVSMVFNILCAPAPTEHKAAPHADAGSSGAAHILVVDDNATNRMVAEALCEMFDCTSECACDGVEAVEIAGSGRFDVILMDIKMPRMDGIAATQAIRAMAGPAGDVPIIALTANVDPEDARAYLASGMCSVVEKPIKPDRLLLAINEALASGAQRHSAAA